MTNRRLGFIVVDQDPLTMAAQETIQHACQKMWVRRVGGVLVTDRKGHLTGILTGRDVVRVIGEGRDPAKTTLADSMTANPDTIGPECTAIDALRLMGDGGFRHVPIVKAGEIVGIVSRGDFKGLELDRFEEERALWERIA